MPETIRLLYECGVLQGDLNRYNFLMTDQGAIIFDFEVATIKEVVGAKELNGEQAWWRNSRIIRGLEKNKILGNCSLRRKY